MKRTIIIRDADASAAPTAASGRSRRVRVVLTVLCALLADGLQLVLPFLWFVWDGAMVLAILTLWGWRWEILVAIIPEVFPGLSLAPTWTIFAGYLVLGRRRDTPRRSEKTVTEASLERPRGDDKS